MELISIPKYPYTYTRLNSLTYVIYIRRNLWLIRNYFNKFFKIFRLFVIFSDKFYIPYIDCDMVNIKIIFIKKFQFCFPYVFMIFNILSTEEQILCIIFSFAEYNTMEVPVLQSS